MVGARLPEEHEQGKTMFSMATNDPVASRSMKVRVKEGCSELKLAGAPLERAWIKFRTPKSGEGMENVKSHN